MYQLPDGFRALASESVSETLFLLRLPRAFAPQPSWQAGSQLDNESVCINPSNGSPREQPPLNVFGIFIAHMRTWDIPEFGDSYARMEQNSFDSYSRDELSEWLDAHGSNATLDVTPLAAECVGPAQVRAP